MRKRYYYGDWLAITHGLVVFSWLMLVAVLLTRRLPTAALSSPAGVFGWDKLIHLVLFAFLARLIAGWLLRHTSISRARAGWIAIAVAAATSAFFEFLQGYLPTRTRDSADLAAGILGALIGVGVWRWYQHWHPERHQRPRLLLHVCCGPCGSDLIGDLKRRFRLTLYFNNHNIDTRQEFDRRWQQVKIVARHWGVPAILESYRHATWRRLARGHEHENEGGARCPVCFALRLKATAQLAQELKFAYFSTTLSVGPRKNFEQLNTIGQNLAKRYKVKFLAEDFKQQAGYQKSVAASQRLKLYRQNYCGCEFSRRVKS